jgi:aspartyl-tRNA(Asn)/glutamyl-tRNA(Gln) amidotransferase subunit B
MFASGETAQAIVEREGLAQISDTGALETLVQKVLDANASEVEKYLGGKTTLLGWFVGQVMRETRGKANPNTVSEILQKRLEERRG